jgi:hypothetical protein
VRSKQNLAAAAYADISARHLYWHLIEKGDQFGADSGLDQSPSAHSRYPRDASVTRGERCGT